VAETKTKMPEDRTALGEKWAAVIAEIDLLEEQLRAAKKLEAEVWAALESSRRKTINVDE
jgi:hypothetical protein